MSSMDSYLHQVLQFTDCLNKNKPNILDKAPPPPQFSNPINFESKTIRDYFFLPTPRQTIDKMDSAFLFNRQYFNKKRSFLGPYLSFHIALFKTFLLKIYVQISCTCFFLPEQAISLSVHVSLIRNSHHESN